MAEREAAIESKRGRGGRKDPRVLLPRGCTPGLCSPRCIGERGTWAFKFPERIPEMGQKLLWTPDRRLFGQEGANHEPGCSALPKLCLPQFLFLHLGPNWLGLGSEPSIVKGPLPSTSSLRVVTQRVLAVGLGSEVLGWGSEASRQPQPRDLLALKCSPSAPCLDLQAHVP